MSNSPKNLYKKLLGKRGELLTIKYLKKLKFTILETNYVTPFGEADVIAKKGDNVVFVEVKTRTSTKFGTPGQAVDYKKQERYRQIALYYIKEKDLDDNIVVSFSVSEVLNGKINYIEEAF